MFRYYSDFIDRKVHITKAKDTSDLENLRNYLFLSIVKVLLPLGFFADVYNIYAALLDQEYIIAIVDFAAFLFLVLLVFAKFIPMHLKRYGLIGILYSLTVFLLILVGEKGPGLIWLLSLSVMATGLVSIKFGYISIIMNLGVLTLLYVLTQIGLISIPGYADNTSVMWFVILTNFALMSYISVFSTGHLLNGLNDSLLRIKRINSDLKVREEQLLVMYQSINEAVIVVNLQNRVKGMNYKAEEMTGYTQSEAYNMQLSHVYQVKKSGQSVLIGSKYFSKGTLMAKTGLRYEIEESITDLDNYGDATYRQVIVFRDMTPYIKIENELRQSHKMQAVGQLAGGIAHDFNNMLAGILGYAELIELENQDNRKIAQYSKVIIDSSKRAADLTNQLLAFSRQDIIEKKEVELNSIIEEGINLLKRTINPNITISKELAREDLFINGDKAQIQNVILNIGINARDAMIKGGNMVIISEKVQLDEVFCSISKFDIVKGDYAKITISDDGEGIPTSIIDRIFDPFFTTKQIGKGTGLGLSTVYGTMIAHNGALEVESKEKVGTIFYLYFPLSQDSCGTEVHHVPLDQIPVDDGMKILIIEDEVNFRDLIQSVLELIGIQVIMAHNGEEGVNLFERYEENISLVILDSTLPLRNGADTLKAIRKLNKNVPIIMTANHLDELEKSLLDEHHVQGFLNKPYTIKELTNLVAENLRMENPSN